jgi:hypothetical protein
VVVNPGTEPKSITLEKAYVDSATGNDSNTGLLEESPKQSVFGGSGAMASASVVDGAGALVVCAASHREAAISSAYSFSKGGVSIVSKGSGSDRATFTSAVAAQPLFTSNGKEYNRFENCIFAASTAASTARFNISNAGWELRDCYFYCGANDAADTVLVSANGVDLALIGCTFKASVAGAARAIKASGACAGLLIEDCTVDGGSVGWAGDAVSLAAAITGFRIRNLTLQNYSDLNLSVTAAKGYISGINCDATSSWTWTP